MDPREVRQGSIKEVSAWIRNGEVSSTEIVKDLIERTRGVNKKLNAYISVLEKDAVTAARRADEEIRSGKSRGPLHGIPVSVKDILAVRGSITSAASKLLAENLTDYDATSVEHLREAGAIIIGKNNCHEFAYGPTAEDSYYGPCRNPWNPELVTGGSSGGSASAVAACLCYGSLGTDTGGSSRIPSSYCGTVGFKPTYGRVSRFGVIPLSWNLDHVSPIARTVEDAAILLEAIAGMDPRDSTSSERPVPRYQSALSNDFKRMKVGVLGKYLEECLDQEVRRRVETAVEVIRGLGVPVSEISIPKIEHSAPVANMLIACEATSIHEKWLKERREDYQPSVRTRLEVGYFYSANHYVKALRLREWFRREFDRVFKSVDVLLSPTCPILPFKIGQETIDVGGRKTDPRPFIANFVRIYNLLGLPALSVPCGFSSSGLPIGLQIAGRPFDEETVLKLAYAYEQAQPWKDRLPNI